MRRVAIALMFLAISAGSVTAQTLTTKEVVELSKAGMAEECPAGADRGSPVGVPD